MPKPMKCPNCKAPVEADPSSPTFQCDYCGHTSKHTAFFRAVVPASLPTANLKDPTLVKRDEVLRKIQAARKTGAKVALIIALAALLPAIIGIVVPLIVTTSVRNTLSEVSSRFKPRGRTTAPEPGGGLIPEPKDQVAAEKKIKAYALCYYRFVERVEDSQTRYFGWVKSREKGPTCKESLVTWGLFQLTDPSGCATEVAAVRASAPRFEELERQGDAFVAALRTLVPVNNEAFKYYEAKEYIEDECVKGKELHAKLVAGFDAVKTAQESFLKALDLEEGALVAKRLAWSQANEPGAFRGDLLKLHSEGRAMLAVLREESRGKTADVSKIKAATTAYKQALVAFTRAAKDQSQATWVGNTAKELEGAAREFLHRKIKKEKPDHWERAMRRNSWSARTLKGTLGHVEHAWVQFLVSLYELRL